MITIGKDTIYGQNYKIEPARHIALIGGSGVGKSSLLEHIFINFIREGNGGLFIDPHGDTADRLALLIPKRRLRDFIWFDPDEKSVPPFNPLFYKTPEQLELGKEALFTTIKSLAGTSWGDESARITINALDAVCELFPNPTPVHVFRFMADDDFRQKILVKTKSPFLKLFKNQYDNQNGKGLRDSDRMAKFSPPINKFGKLMRPNILPIIGQPQSLDLLELMNTKKIVVCRLSKGRLGEETAQIIGSLLVAMVSIAALKRENQTNRPPFMLAVDEIHSFIHGGRFGPLLAEARKYAISLVMAFQGGYQIPFIKDILSNSNTQIIFNSSGEDAAMLTENWNEPNVTPQHITSELTRFKFYSRTFQDNLPVVKKVEAPPQLKPRRKAAEKIINQSLMRWSISKEKTNEKILRFLAS